MSESFNIKDKFSEQYTLIIDSDIKAVNVHMISRSQLRWDFTVLQVAEDHIKVKIIVLDHILLEANNPLIKEVAALTNAFSRLYNELYLTINSEGKVVEVSNMNVIRSKWQQTKAEMEKIAENNPEIKNAIILNDNIFQDEKKLIEGIQNNEFFLMYFNKIYGRKIPGNYKENALNLFNSANVHWSFDLKNSSNPLLSSDEMIVELSGEPSILLNIGFYNRAYIQFSNQIDVSKLETSLNEKGIYRTEKSTGRIIEASLTREEIADPENLYAKLKYTFYSDEILKYKMSDEYNTATS
ncbi:MULTISPECIES: hypothetical protein [Chryseobacterium]|uniref:hypothetical protein n=1 Tax=Chryseobacterium TaxID=59732 RepID=UPI001555AB28|nr:MULTISPECIES: hypothetical protein [unclassified Chryseobacterium]MDC8106937.1 hypothetical protein [Chryseobacterium sp. B21-037]MDQ1805781.1 hypothetical protein [Chryseobacterium sp. CKR4-1]